MALGARVLLLNYLLELTVEVRGRLTGSSRGIGAAIAKRLAKDGASVLVHYSASPDRAAAVVAEIEKAGGTAEPVGADLSTADGPAKLLAQIARPPAVVSLDALTSL